MKRTHDNGKLVKEMEELILTLSLLPLRFISFFIVVVDSRLTNAKSFVSQFFSLLLLRCLLLPSPNGTY